MYKLIIFLFFLMLIVYVKASNEEKSLIKNYAQLLDAVRNNEPPNGYINLANCTLDKNKGDLHRDKKVYRINFNDNYAFEPYSREIYSAQGIVQKTNQRKGNQMLISIQPATMLISVKPKQDYIEATILMKKNDSTILQTYNCSWQKGVYLWKES